MQFLCFRTELPQKCLQHVFSAAVEQKDLLLWENLSASVSSGKNYTMDKPYSHRWKDQAFLWTLTLFSAATCVKLSVPPTGCSAASSLNLVFTLPLFPVFLYGTVSCYGKHICLWLKKKKTLSGDVQKRLTYIFCFFMSGRSWKVEIFSDLCAALSPMLMNWMP